MLLIAVLVVVQEEEDQPPRLPRNPASTELGHNIRLPQRKLTDRQYPWHTSTLLPHHPSVRCGARRWWACANPWRAPRVLALTYTLQPLTHRVAASNIAATLTTYP